MGPLRWRVVLSAYFIGTKRSPSVNWNQPGLLDCWLNICPSSCQSSWPLNSRKECKKKLSENSPLPRLCMPKNTIGSVCWQEAEQGSSLVAEMMLFIHKSISKKTLEMIIRVHSSSVVGIPCMGGNICAAVAKKWSIKKCQKKIRFRKMIFRPYYGCVIKRRILSHTHTVGAAGWVMELNDSSKRSSVIKPHDRSCESSAQHCTRRVSPRHSPLSFSAPPIIPLPLLPLFLPLSVTCFPSHMFSLSSHVILSPSFTGSTGWEYLGELRPGCKEHSRSGILPVLALPQPTPLKPEHTYSFPSAPVTPASTHPSRVELRLMTFVTPSTEFYHFIGKLGDDTATKGHFVTLKEGERKENVHPLIDEKLLYVSTATAANIYDIFLVMASVLACNLKKNTGHNSRSFNKRYLLQSSN